MTDTEAKDPLLRLRSWRTVSSSEAIAEERRKRQTTKMGEFPDHRP